MTYKGLDTFIECISTVTTINAKLINRGNAEYLWRLINGHEISIPQKIKDDVLRYLRSEDAKARNHSPSKVLEAIMGVEDNYIFRLLREPNVIEYLQAH